MFSEITESINSTEMASLKFRDIAVISGMVFRGIEGKEARQLRSSSSLIFKVFKEHEPNNLLLKQADEEVLEFQLEENRLRNALKRIEQQKIVIQYPNRFTPLSFPILVDRLRQKLSSEKLEDKIRRIQEQNSI